MEALSMRTARASGWRRSRSMSSRRPRTMPAAGPPGGFWPGKRRGTRPRRRPPADARLVVAEVGAVRRAHLDGAGAGLRHDLRDAEAAADLDELAARDDDLAPLTQRRQRQEQRRGVVVHGDRRPAAGDAPQQPFYVLV